MRWLLAAFALVLSGCAAEPPAPNSPASAPLSTPAAPVQQLQGIEGEYTVVFVDGAPPVINIPGYAPTITIGPDRIHFQSQCIYADWTYELNGEAISTKPYFKPGSGMCARGLAPGETLIKTAFGSLETIRRIRGDLYGEGGGHRVQLQRKTDADRIALRAVDLAGAWRVAAIDGRQLDPRYGLALTADHDQIWWEPACALQYRAYTITGARFATRPPDQTPREVCDIAVPRELAQVWSALDVANTIAPATGNGALIGGRGRSVLLYSQ
jgi:hypothetical protein